MKYYVIINGNSSLNIQGLAIESLPNISKPLIRTSREEIDGRDGDIITKLGYSAYDKTLNIGLWGNYDINEVIAFFNQEGVITFSNEPDKYYKFTILNRIDFVNELEKFKKASITIHCQPFKYQEQPEVVAEEEAVELTGTSFKITDSLEAPLLMDLKGNTSQYTLSGKNKFNTNNLTLNTLSGLTSSIKDATLKLNGTNSSQGYIITTSSTGVVLPAGTYTLSMVVKGTCNILDTNYNTVLYLLNGNTNTSFHNMSFRTTYYNSSKTQSSQFTLTDSTPISVQMYTNGSVAYNNIEIMIQIESGSSFTGFEPYCGGVPSPNPSYPQNVNVVSGDNDIVVCGKNLFDYDNIIPTTITSRGYSSNASYNSTTNELTFTAINNDTFMPALWPEANFINGINVPVKKNTNYILNCITDDNTHARLGVYGTDGNKYYAIVDSTSTIPLQFNSGNWDQIAIRIGVNGKNGGTIKFSKFQIEEGTTLPTYTPYTGTTYNIDLPVENFYEKGTIQWFRNSSTDYDNRGNTNTTRIKSMPFQIAGGTYTISGIPSLLTLNAGGPKCYDANKTYLGDAYVLYSGNTFTLPSNVAYVAIMCNGTSLDDTTNTLMNNADIQIEQGSKANTYTPYGTTPIELNKIGNYQDYFYKEDDKWYLHKEVGKLTFDGTEAWSLFFNTNGIFVYNPSSQSLLTDDTINGLSNYYTCTTRKYIRNNLSEADNVFSIYAQELVVANKSISSAADFKTWLSTHRLNVYYILKTPTNTEITYQPLINQLNALEDAESYEGTTNINQVNNDLPFIIGLTYFTGDNTITITNDGNIYSKPLLRIKGTSDISISLNGIQIFQITLQNNEIIIIDTEKMEAYYDGILKNRQVIGDYNNFKLNPGENTIEINGAFDYVRISRYSRWV